MNNTTVRTLALKRKLRTRSKLRQHSNQPRLVIFRSNKYTYLQVVDHVTHQVMASADSRAFEKGKAAVTKLEAAQQAAEALAKTLQAKKITAVTLDRASYKYHGRVKAVADTLRAGKVQV